MTTIAQTSKFLRLPTDVLSEVIDWLPLKDLKNLNGTCKRLRAIFPWKKIEQSSITQLSQYIKRYCCSWCEKAIILIQESCKSTELNRCEVVRLVSDLVLQLKSGSSLAYPYFSPILKALKCDEKLEPDSSPPFISEID